MLLLVVLGAGDKSFTNDYHTLYFLLGSYVVTTLVILMRAIACAKPIGSDALVAIHRDRNLLLSYPVKLPYDPEVRTALDVWTKVEECVGQTETFFTKDAKMVARALGSRLVALATAAALALSPLVATLVQPGSCFGKGALDHPVVTAVSALVLFFAGLVLASDLFDIAASTARRPTPSRPSAPFSWPRRPSSSRSLTSLPPLRRKTWPPSTP